METGISWNPPTLLDAINNGYECEFNFKKPIKNSNKTKYQCPGCGAFAWPACFDDVRSIAGINGDFICDGCYTKLERNLIDIDGDGKPDTTLAFKERYILQHKNTS